MTVERASKINHEDEFRCRFGSEEIAREIDFEYLSTEVIFASYRHLERKLLLHVRQSDRADLDLFIDLLREGATLDELRLDMTGGAPFDIVGTRATLTDHETNFTHVDDDGEPIVQTHVLEFTCEQTRMVRRVEPPRQETKPRRTALKLVAP